MKQNIIFFLVGIILTLATTAAFQRCTDDEPPECPEIISETESVTEVKDTAPTPRDSVVIRYVDVTAPVKKQEGKPGSLMADTLPIHKIELVNDVLAESSDSVTIILPITQTKYETSDYRAYVSGYDAKLDSIIINRTESIIKIRSPTKPKRFSIGVQAGMGITPRGFQPYLGVGISANLYSF